MWHKLTIHCHFYQPPRENPWTEEVEPEKEAYPYANWNERITYECYSKLMPVFSQISQNWGPTLLRWLKREFPHLYSTLRTCISKHKNALMQPYYHVIFPLSDSMDKEILIKWGAKSFLHNFNHKPLGIWLPELAVDLETLRLAEKVGLRFAILGCHQIKANRPGFYKILGTNDFYVFAFDRDISGAIAFAPEELFEPKKFLNFMRERLKNSDSYTLIALDGETFGHHKRRGDIALKAVVNGADFRLMSLNDAFFLFSNHFQETEIIENTSWSCVHGVARWKEHCGCNTGVHPHWSQHWRTPLRKAVEWLKEKIDEIFFAVSPRYFKDPWKALMDYVLVVEERNFYFLNRFLNKHLKVNDPNDCVKAIKLMEMKNASLAMFTSCGWFFDDISGTESQIVMRYAKRALDLAFEVSQTFLEAGFLNILSKAESNIKEYGTGKDIYLKFVVPMAKRHEEIITEALKENENEETFMYKSLLIQVLERESSAEWDVRFDTLKVLTKSVISGEKRISHFIRLSSPQSVMVFSVKVGSDEKWEELQKELHQLMIKDIVKFFFKIFNLIQL